MDEKMDCPICASSCALLDVVDFNKSCEEARGKFLKLSGRPVYYVRCSECGYCFCPEICSWSMPEFDRHIYNSDYISIDPDYVEARPTANASILQSMFKDFPIHIKHLDYGGGNGLLSGLLKEKGWNSSTFDPYVTRNIAVDTIGRYDLITAFEVFEHVPDPNALMDNISQLVSDDGVILFSTLVSDGHISDNKRLDWWYASPRNGHISLYTKNSLERLANKCGFKFGSFSDGFHMMFRNSPPWAAHFFS
ncbi:class I SAM-dependent methyltransferase [Jeongeupia wiesaeckerbachi]|uniref:class I SAM-dependent methyltransferase n=1 Tax=Jeongeupia wiesaeckerbachi TaxID=3051218 RepID=UPI003D80449A